VRKPPLSGAAPGGHLPRRARSQRCRPDAEEREKPGGAFCDEWLDQLVEAGDLLVEGSCSTPELSEREAGGLINGVPGPRAQCRGLGHESRGVAVGEVLTQVVGTARQQTPELVDRRDPVAPRRALRDEKRADRLHLAVPSFGSAAARPD